LPELPKHLETAVLRIMIPRHLALSCGSSISIGQSSLAIIGSFSNLKAWAGVTTNAELATIRRGASHKLAATDFRDRIVSPL
jgi:hypothetical protein